MANNEVVLHLKIESEGEGTLKTIEADAQELAEVIDKTSRSSENLNGHLLDLNQGAEAIRNVVDGIGSLADKIGELTGMYAAAEEAQVKLATIMKQRMGATDADVESIKELTEAQKELGVVDDDVANSGAQQMATFLSRKSSLETLIPAMNDLIAQQKGLNATEEDAVSIGNMMGKAMQGSTEVLQRVGISFTEAQAKVLKYGTESERAAMLAEVITANVGHMNRALAQTDAGRAKQLEMTFEDLGKSIGETLSFLDPVIAGLHGVGEAVSGIGATAYGVSALVTSMRNLHAANVMCRISALATALAEKAEAAARVILTGSTNAATMSVRAFTVASAALYTLLTVGLIIAIQAVVASISALRAKMREAREEQERLRQEEEDAKRVHEQANRALEEQRTKLMMDIQALKAFRGSKEQEKQVVEQMNSTYGQTMGYYSSVADWYNALVANSKAYCDQLVNEARLRELANKASTLQGNINDITRDENGRTRRYSKERGYHTEKQLSGGRLIDVRVQDKSDWEKAQDRVRGYGRQLSAVKSEMQGIADSSARLSAKLFTGSAERGGDDGKSTPKSGKVTPAPKITYEAVPVMNINSLEDTLRAAGLRASGELRGTIDVSGMLKGSMNGKLGKYDELSSEAGNIQRAMEAGILPLSHAELLINQVNTGLKEIGAKPIKLKVNDSKLTEFRAKVSEATQAVGQMGSAFSSLGSSLQMPVFNVIGTLAQAVATMVLSFSQALAKSAGGGPWAWISFGAVGLAQLASMISAVKGMSKFAEGGIAYGPTLGLMGEYANAGRNPEVIAPLDRLRAIIGEGGAGSGSVEFRIKGRNLEGVLQRRNRMLRRN